jgi:hypothetical protein
LGVTKLRDVFGISSRVDSASYVDRGGLDELFALALASDKHIAVHGGSKQGKSWLRSRGLSDAETLLVQCTPSSTVASIFTEALGRLNITATLKMTKTRDVTGTLDFTSSGELGKLIAKAKAQATAGITAGRSVTEESAPIGHTPADLLWVCLSIFTSGKRLVLEDFHYLAEDMQREFAFFLKAMGEYSLFVVIVGVWPRDHLLTYFNGDLDGRVEDIHLNWKDSELERVVNQGARELNIEIPTAITQSMVLDAYGSVGLLQRLAEQYCLEMGVLERRIKTQRLLGEGGSQYLDARVKVASQMQGRYQTFADNFV